MKTIESWLSRTEFWVAIVCALILVVFVVSVFASGFSVVQLTVLFVPLAVYALAIKTFGENSVIEMGVQAIIVALLLAILLPVFRRAALNRRNHEQKMALQKRAAMRGHLVAPKALRHEESGVKPQPTK